MQQLLQGNEELRSRVEEMSWRGDDTSIARVSIQWIMQRMGSNAITDSGVEPLEESAMKRLVPRTEDLPVKRRQFLERQFLQQLQYKDMDNREEMVEEAHKKTFRWIFDDSDRLENGDWANFREWLDSPKQLYWITGKPGSGKSTLMKFIWEAVALNDPERPHSDLGPEDKHLTVANFYFWAAGSSIQRSREGLYRTLLYQLLKQHAHAIAKSSPDRWEVLCLFGAVEKRFTEHELQSMLRHCLGQLQHRRVCLFIDGLDEFSGNYDDLVKFFSKLIDDYPVKLCLSSRPLLVFEEAFQDKPSLRIHELTHRDIDAYVMSQFQKSPSFITLRSHDEPYIDDLVKQILQRAQGVFLWVKLVVASLVEGLRDGDTRIETQRRLDRLPDDLEDLFHRILLDLRPEHQRKAALYLGFMSLCPEPPLALLFSFAEEEDPEFALKFPISRLSDSAIDERIIILRKRVNTGCRGLLEVTPDGNDGYQFHRIQYYHRTVKDYVETTRAQNLLAGHKELNHHVRLCSGNLALYKSFGENDITWNTKTTVCHCLAIAAFVPKSDTKMMIRILDELEKSCQGRLAQIGSQRDRARLGVRCLYMRYTLEGKFRDPGMRPFDFFDDFARFKVRDYEDFNYSDLVLVAAVKCNAVEWVRHKVAGKNDHRHFGWAIRALKYVPSSKMTFAPSILNLLRRFDLLLREAVICDIPSPDMVEFLLRSGASSAAMIRGLGGNGLKLERSKKKIAPARWLLSSIWESTIVMVIHGFCVNSKMSPQNRPNWRRVAQLMVAHGASVSRSKINHAIGFMFGMDCDIASVREDMDVARVLKTGLKVLTTSEAKKRGQREIPGWRVTWKIAPRLRM